MDSLDIQNKSNTRPNLSVNFNSTEYNANKINGLFIYDNVITTSEEDILGLFTITI